ncbi:MAG: DUF4058 family protein [Chloroflexota bacterium]
MKFDHNIFPGINPYQHSKLLNRGWAGFHNGYIFNLTSLLQSALLPLGYRVSSEEGVQLKKSGSPRVRLPQSDALILSPGTGTTSPSQKNLPVATAEQPIEQVFVDVEPDENQIAVAIYSGDETDEHPITWIELLSPTNKPPNINFEAYSEKREHLLRAGVSFVEIDLIHNRKPTFPTRPDYTQAEKHAQPYRITSINPHPDFYTGTVQYFEFGVMDRIPLAAVPLENGDLAGFDFMLPYTMTFDGLVYAAFLDYSTPAGDLLGYHEADKAAIAAHVKAADQ